MTLSPGRVVGIIAGAAAILVIGVYGPAMLLGPLPQVQVRLDDDAVAGAQVAGADIPMPAEGSSVLSVVNDDGEAEPIASGGSTETVPIGGVAKLVAVLVTVESLPLPADGDGPAIPIGPADFTDYLRYSGEGSRALQVSPGESWSQRDVVRAVLLSSSNNHADTLVRWAFGSVDAYVVAANTWLADNGYAATRVADATGLSGDNIGTADELASLAAKLLADSGVGPLFSTEAGATPATPGTSARSTPDVIAHLGDVGARALSRSFTDQAGLCYLFTTEIASSDDSAPRRLVGVVLRMPDYDVLDPAVAAMIEGARAAAEPVELIAAGSSYGQAEAAWGDRAELVATADRASAGWGAATAEASVTVDPFTTAPAGREVGRISVPVAGGEVGSPLELGDDIRDPGPFWRLTHPADLIGAFFDDET